MMLFTSTQAAGEELARENVHLPECLRSKNQAEKLGREPIELTIEHIQCGANDKIVRIAHQENMCQKEDRCAVQLETKKAEGGKSRLEIHSFRGVPIVSMSSPAARHTSHKASVEEANTL